MNVEKERILNEMQLILKVIFGVLYYSGNKVFKIKKKKLRESTLPHQFITKVTHNYYDEINTIWNIDTNLFSTATSVTGTNYWGK